MTLRQFESPSTGVVARPTGNGRFQAEISVRGSTFLADEPAEVGGNGTGPTPYELLSAALASCTAMTLRLYADRKGWELPPFSVEVAHSLIPGADDGTPPRDRFDRHIALNEDLEPDRLRKLIEMADKCPVHRTLVRGFVIHTSLGPASDHPQGQPAAQHERDLEAACAEDRT
jgi:putative redox protein